MLNIDDLKLSVAFQRALLFNVSDSMRFISCEVSNDNILNVYIYFSKKPTELDLDLIYSAAGEVCGDFPGLDNSKVKYFVDNNEFNTLKHLRLLIFARNEINI